MDDAENAKAAARLRAEEREMMRKNKNIFPGRRRSGNAGIHNSFNFPVIPSISFSAAGPIATAVFEPGFTCVWPASRMSAQGSFAFYAESNASSSSFSEWTLSVIFIMPDSRHALAHSGLAARAFS